MEDLEKRFAEIQAEHARKQRRIVRRASIILSAIAALLVVLTVLQVIAIVCK